MRVIALLLVVLALVEAKKDIQAIMDVADVNGDGVLSEPETLLAAKNARLSMLPQVFAHIDVDGDRALSADEIGNFLQQQEMESQQAQGERLMQLGRLRANAGVHVRSSASVLAFTADLERVLGSKCMIQAAAGVTLTCSAAYTGTCPAGYLCAPDLASCSFDCAYGQQVQPAAGQANTQCNNGYWSNNIPMDAPGLSCATCPSISNCARFARDCTCGLCSTGFTRSTSGSCVACSKAGCSGYASDGTCTCVSCAATHFLAATACYPKFHGKITMQDNPANNEFPLKTLTFGVDKYSFLFHTAAQGLGVNSDPGWNPFLTGSVTFSLGSSGRGHIIFDNNPGYCVCASSSGTVFINLYPNQCTAAACNTWHFSDDSKNLVNDAMPGKCMYVGGIVNLAYRTVLFGSACTQTYALASIIAV